MRLSCPCEINLVHLGTAQDPLRQLLNIRTLESKGKLNDKRGRCALDVAKNKAGNPRRENIDVDFDKIITIMELGRDLLGDDAGSTETDTGNPCRRTNSAIQTALVQCSTSLTEVVHVRQELEARGASVRVPFGHEAI